MRAPVLEFLVDRKLELREHRLAVELLPMEADSAMKAE